MNISSKITLNPTLVLGGVTTALLVAYALIFSPGLLTPKGGMGQDYSFVLPNLLTGYYWFVENGPLSIPWFAPGQCGGFPFFPDPNSGYFSVPQFLSFVVSPYNAVRLTLLIFAALGFYGFYALMRQGFGSSKPAALFSAGLFMFNGFYIYRMLVGHITFHTFMLLPLILAAVISTPRNTAVPAHLQILRLAIATLAMGYMIQNGIVHVFLPAALAMVWLLLLQAALFGWRWSSWVNLGLATLFASLLSASKLVAMLSLLANFPRDYYPLPGIRGFAATLEMAFQIVFFRVPNEAPLMIANSAWTLDRHEWEYGVSPAPLLFMVLAAVFAGVKAWRLKKWPTIAGWSRWLAVLAMLALLTLPVLLNWYSLEWNRLLKQIPLIGNSSNMLRWFCTYIPIAVILGGLALDRIPIPAVLRDSGKPILTGLGLLLMLVFNAQTNLNYYFNQMLYPISTVESAWKSAKYSKSIPDIKTIEKGPPANAGPNDGLVRGVSAVVCYQPIMGYRLEKFPRGTLHAGPVFGSGDEYINLKNPACYLFPEENQCKLGAHFLAATQTAEAEALTHYRPFAFQLSNLQQIANTLSGFSLLVAVLGLMIGLALNYAKVGGFAAGFRSRSTQPTLVGKLD